MAEEASYGLMIWDGKSVGTLMNVARLVRQGKTVVVYTVPAKRFTDLKTEAHWEAFLSGCASDVRSRIDRESAAEQSATERRPDQPGTQAHLL